MAKILVAEDDRIIGESIVDGLRSAGHTIDWVRNGSECADRLRLYHYDAAVVDWNMPGQSGVDVCRAYRESGGNAPLLLLTARDKESEKVEGLDSGADDYLTKPFSVAELNARIRALLRRNPQTSNNVLQVGDLIVDVAQARVTRAGMEVELLHKEFALLEFLMRRPNQVFSVHDLLNMVWSSESESGSDAVRQAVVRLRKKLDIPGRRCPITTVKGLGYKVEDV